MFRSPPIPPGLVYLSVLLAIGRGARGVCKLSNVFLSLPPATYIQERGGVRAPCCLCPSPCTSSAVERAFSVVGGRAGVLHCPSVHCTL